MGTFDGLVEGKGEGKNVGVFEGKGEGKTDGFVEGNGEGKNVGIAEGSTVGITLTNEGVGARLAFPVIVIAPLHRPLPLQPS